MESVQRLSRNQVHEKLKKNFHALCRNCPQNGPSAGVDDSLTNLQWLWNLNVNLNNPVGNSSLSVPHASKTSNPKHENYLSIFPIDQMLQHKPRPTGPSPPTNNYQTTGKRGSASNSSKKGSMVKSVVYEGTPSVLLTNNSEASMPDCPATGSYSMTTLHTQAIQPSNRPSAKSRGSIKIPSTELVQTICTRKESLESLKNYSSSETPAFFHQRTSLPDTVQLPGRSFGTPARLEALPGYVDHGNNPYVKPSFSFTTLICMALNNSKRNHMTFPSICKWIKDNFIYYRYADSGWQNSVKLNLNQSKFFCKVEKKRDTGSKVSYWQIDSLYAKQLREVSLQSCGKALSRDLSSSQSVDILSSACSSVKFEPSSFACIGRKRKQPSPQKIQRRRSMKKRCNIAAEPAKGDKDLLQEQAPELGSLKGDFNWNSIFDDFFGATDGGLSITPTSLTSTTTSTPSNLESDRSSTHKGAVVSTIYSGPALWNEAKVNDENHDASLSCLIDHSVESPWALLNDDLPPLCKPSNSVNLVDQSNAADDFFLEASSDNTTESNIQTFFKDVDDIDLTITGKQIAPPSDWTPVTAQLSDILCEKHDDNLFMNGSLVMDGESEIFSPLPLPQSHFSDFTSSKNEASGNSPRTNPAKIKTSSLLL